MVKPSNAASQVTSLVEKARSGSGDAFNRLVAMFHKDIYRLVYYRIGNAMDAEDLTQDIFTRAFSRLSSLKETDRFRAWLYSIGLNRIKDYYRKKRLRSIFGKSTDANEIDHYPENTENPDGFDSIEKQEFWKLVRALLDKLPKMEREVFTLRFMDHLTIREISQTLKKHESTVKTHLYRAIQKFRKETELLQYLKEAPHELS